jgi:hypothetical protein
MATTSFKVRCKMGIKDILFPILALCFMSWLIVKMSAIPTSQQMRNEIIELKFAPVSAAATQLVDLQDQLSTRMAQHRNIMSSNLDEFNTTLANVTHMADQSVSHLTFLRNLLVIGSGGSNLDWIQAVTLLVDAEGKLRNHTLGDDLRLKLETLTQNAGVMAKEMEDMELFMLDIDNRTNTLMDDLTKALHDEEEHQAEVSLPKTADNNPQHRGILASFFGGLLFNGNPVNPPAAQSLRWSWDVIVDGNVHPIFGEFTEVQKGLIQRMCLLSSPLIVPHSPFPESYIFPSLPLKNIKHVANKTQASSPTTMSPPSQLPSPTAQASLTPSSRRPPP